MKYSTDGGNVYQHAGGPGTGGDEKVYVTRVRDGDEDQAAAAEYLGLDADRWQPWELRLIAEHKCPYQTGYGLPWMEYCKRAVDPDADGAPFCPEHAGN
jgi:hypothetical protein